MNTLQTIVLHSFYVISNWSLINLSVFFRPMLLNVQSESLHLLQGSL
jgi:hypothetical protein